MLLLIAFVLPSLRSGTWDVRTSSSLCSPAVSHPAAHTVSGRYCCNFSRYERIQSAVLVSIPQAVSVVAWSPLFYPRFAQVLEMCGLHRRFAPLLSRTLRRIPWTVGAVATYVQILCMSNLRFNTASGRCCCNYMRSNGRKRYLKKVSIP